MPLERFLRAHLAEHPIALHLVDGAGGDADVNGHVLGLPRPVDPRDRLLGEFGRPARRQPRHPRPAVLQIEPVPGRGRMKGEQRQRRPRSTPRPAASPRARRRRPAERRHRPEGAPDGAQILDELVGDQQRLAVEALDQLAQPVDLQAVDERPDRRCPRRRESRWPAARSLPVAISGEAASIERSSIAANSSRCIVSVGRHHGVRQLERRHHDVERRQVGHVLVGDRHRDGAEFGGDLLLRPRQGHPFAPERIARPEVPLLPGHEGAAPQRAVGDDRRPA